MKVTEKNDILIFEKIPEVRFCENIFEEEERMTLVYIVLGILIGCGLNIILLLSINIGTLRVDSSDPYDNPYLFLELSKSLNSLISKKYVILKVDFKNYISHK